MIDLIDCENVGETSLSGIVTLPKTDEAVLFFGKQQTTVSMDTHCLLMNCSCHVAEIVLNQSGPAIWISEEDKGRVYRNQQR